MIDDKCEIVLNEQTYNGRLDMGAIANIQQELQKIKKNITIPEIFNEVSNENYSAINQIIIQSITRCHPQLKEADILLNMKLKEKDDIVMSVLDLMKKALPIDEDKKKVTDM
ncbi:hypothetical protein [Paraclostridium bifermentans]|uniref:hypothetical protein n=1 Tax=Paraclostridium bifermentans TaxID=1490 RepID=UPI0022DFB657|nr:hypothetical protein [Paraclostridium bifermentans]